MARVIKPVHVKWLQVLWVKDLEEKNILLFGIKHRLITKPKDSDSLIYCEAIYEHLENIHALLTPLDGKEKIKNSLRAFAFNLSDFEQATWAHIKKSLWEHFVFLQPENTKGVILMKRIVLL